MPETAAVSPACAADIWKLKIDCPRHSKPARRWSRDFRDAVTVSRLKKSREETATQGSRERDYYHATGARRSRPLWVTIMVPCETRWELRGLFVDCSSRWDGRIG
jgi:hypothetical protein